MSYRTAALRLRGGRRVLALAVMLVPALAGSAHAATYNVSNTSEFVSAVNAANASAGADVIQLAPASAYLPSATVNINDDLTIQAGNKFGKLSGSAVSPFPSDFLVVKEGVTATFKGVTITGGGGGGFAAVNVFGNVVVESSLIAGNDGPGVLVEPGATATIRNSTLSDGLDFGLIDQGTADVFNSTIVNNANGGIDSANGTVNLTNTIVANNPGGNCTAPVASSVKSIDSGTSCDVGALSNTNPQFDGGLNPHGGPTESYALKATSPAVDAGTNSPCPAADQRGVLRGDGACDIGAFELDHTPPSLNLPPNITEEATGPSGAAVSYTATATDPEGPADISCSPASGSTFPLGTTTVTCTATDKAGHTTTGAFTVTVKDTTGPVISDVPADKTVLSTDGNPVAVNYTDPTATDAVSGAVSVSCSPASGSAFPLGATTVTCTATDAAGNTSTATFKVTVVTDTTPPVIGPVADITKPATSASGAVVTYTTPTATDDVDGTVPVNCTPASGSTFPIGTATVTCTATDSAGNSASKTFKVTVTRVPTSIRAGTVLGGGLSRVSATLTAGSTPLAGKTITFRAGSAALCTATTNAAGVASCSYNVLQLLNVVLALGYDASYAGDPVYLPATAHGGLL